MYVFLPRYSAAATVAQGHLQQQAHPVPLTDSMLLCTTCRGIRAAHAALRESTSSRVRGQVQHQVMGSTPSSSSLCAGGPQAPGAPLWSATAVDY
jgi:hypothetical protein